MKLLLKNINDLAAKQKSEGLTAFEKERQAALRQEYLKKNSRNCSRQLTSRNNH